MTTATPTPEDRLAAIAAAIVGADRAVMGLETAIRIADSLHRPDTAVALLMLSGDIATAIDALRRCRDVLSRGDAQ